MAALLSPSAGGELELRERVRSLEEELARKQDIISSLTSLLKDTESQCEELAASNLQLKQTLPQSTHGFDACAERGDEDLGMKIDTFLSRFIDCPRAGLEFTKIRATVLNALACLHHESALSDQSLGTLMVVASKGKEDPYAVQVAFSVAAKYFMQVKDEEGMQADNAPMSWLLGMFPFSWTPEKPLSDAAWLPLHLFLATDPDTSPRGLKGYLHDLELVLTEFGSAAFDEEVSPLCIAVAKPYPCLQAVERIVDFRPDCLSAEDEDGCIPIMHACAHNFDPDVARLFLSRCPDSVEQEDNFGCSAIHYAAFCGCGDVVEFLLQNYPRCARKVEGNGALPLHDAVQNSRGHDEQFIITQHLLRVYPQGVFKPDDFGALPLHKAAKSADMQTYGLVHLAFPQALFISDNEDLLPLHYYSQRSDKDQHLDIIQHMLEHNPRCDMLTPKEAAKLYQKVEKESTLAPNPTPKKSMGGMVSAAAAAAAAAEHPASGRRKSCIARGSIVHTGYRK